MVLGNRITCRSTWTAATLLGVACLAFQASAVRAQTPDWGNLQFPSTMNAPAGSTSPQVFGQVYEPGVTDLAGPGAGIVAQLGVGPDGSDPATSLSWQWTTATYNLDVGNNDEYQATFTVPAAIGSYDYCYRYWLNGGPWVYGDFGFEGSQNGYSPADAGQLTVTAAETGINWGNTQSPPSITVDANQPTPNIYGQVWKPGVTDAPGQGSGITAQLGYGPDGTDPATEAGWQWVAASYNLDVGNNDEYFKTLTVTTPGTYDYCYRYAFNSGTWLYADLDGTDNGYSLSQAGSLTVQATTDVPARTPRILSLQALRNPCLGRAELRLTLPYEAAVDLAVFDAGGRLVQRLIAGTRPAGEEVVAWDGCDGSGTPVPHGVYLVRVLAGGEQRAVRLIRLH